MFDKTTLLISLAVNVAIKKNLTNKTMALAKIF
jgi:hypothetical protein